MRKVNIFFFKSKPNPSLPIVVLDLITQFDPIETFPVITTLLRIVEFFPILTFFSIKVLAPIPTLSPRFFLFSTIRGEMNFIFFCYKKITHYFLKIKSGIF